MNRTATIVVFVICIFARVSRARIQPELPGDQYFLGTSSWKIM